MQYQALACQEGAVVIIKSSPRNWNIIESFFGENALNKACRFAEAMNRDLEDASLEELEAVDRIFREVNHG